MSTSWKIDNTYFKIDLYTSNNPELFNIASCENYLAYWDSINTNAQLYIYNIPNNFTKISNINKTFINYSNSSELLIDINKNGECLYFIDGMIGLFSNTTLDISSNIYYDPSYTRIAIGTDKGFIKYKTLDNSYKIQYFNINDAITNNEIQLIDLFTGNLLIDEFTVISIYDDDFVIGSCTNNSGYGVIYVYDNTLINPQMFSYNDASTFFGFQVSTFNNHIIVRSFRSINYNTSENIPIFIYTKNNGIYTKKSQNTINKLSQVFICQTSDGKSYYITNTYEYGNLDRRINIYDDNNENTLVFFDGDSTNQSFSMPTNDYIVERRDITVNDTFLFIRKSEYIYIYANCYTLSFPNEIHGLIPSNSNLLLYNKKGGNTVSINNDSIIYDFSSNYFNPHKFYISNDFLANRTYDTIKLYKYIDNNLDYSFDFSGNVIPIQHNFFDDNNEFIAYNVSEFYLNETYDSIFTYKYNKFELFFNGEANIDEWEFIMFSNKPFYNSSNSQLNSQLNSENIVYSHLLQNYSEYIPEKVGNNSTNIGIVGWLHDNSDHICTYDRPYQRAYGENPIYDDVSINLIKESKKYVTLLHKENAIQNSKSNRAINFEGMSVRKFNELNKFNTSNNKVQIFPLNIKPTYSQSNFNFNKYKPLFKKCYNL